MTSVFLKLFEYGRLLGNSVRLISQSGDQAIAARCGTTPEEKAMAKPSHKTVMATISRLGTLCEPFLTGGAWCAVLSGHFGFANAASPSLLVNID